MADTPIQVSNTTPDTLNINLQNVQVGTVPATDSQAQYADDGDPNGPYADYKIQNRFESDKHIYMLPISSPGGFRTSEGSSRAAFVQLASPTLLWICDWTVARFDVQPQIPNPNQASNTPWILVDEHYEPFSLTLAADGFTKLYRLSGTFVYGHRNPAAATINDIAFPQPAWMAPQSNRDMPPSKLQGGLSLPATEMRGPPR